MKSGSAVERASRKATVALVLATLAILIGSLGAIQRVTAGGPVTSVQPLATAGAALNITWTNTSPLGFSASPCYKPGPYTQLCNVTYWVNKDTNGTCDPNGTGQYLTGLTYTQSTKFYFAGSNPTFPTVLTLCGGGSTALHAQFWFHVIPPLGQVRAVVTVEAA